MTCLQGTLPEPCAIHITASTRAGGSATCQAPHSKPKHSCKQCAAMLAMGHLLLLLLFPSDALHYNLSPTLTHARHLFVVSLKIATHSISSTVNWSCIGRPLLRLLA